MKFLSLLFLALFQAAAASTLRRNLQHSVDLSDATVEVTIGKPIGLGYVRSSNGVTEDYLTEGFIDVGEFLEVVKRWGCYDSLLWLAIVGERNWKIHLRACVPGWVTPTIYVK